MLISFEKITRDALAPLGFGSEERLARGAFTWEKSPVSFAKIIVNIEAYMKNGQLKAFVNFGVHDDHLVRVVERVIGEWDELSNRPLLTAFIGEMFPDQFALARSGAPAAERIALAARSVCRPASDRRYFAGVPVGMYFGPNKKEAAARWREMIDVLIEQLQALNDLVMNGSYISFFDDCRFPLGYRSVFSEALVAVVFSGVDRLAEIIGRAIDGIAEDKQGPEDLRRQSIAYAKNVHEMLRVNSASLRKQYSR